MQRGRNSMRPAWAGLCYIRFLRTDGFTPHQSASLTASPQGEAKMHPLKGKPRRRTRKGKSLYSPPPQYQHSAKQQCTADEVDRKGADAAGVRKGDAGGVGDQERNHTSFRIDLYAAVSC